MGLQCSAQGLKASWTSGVAYVGGRRYQVAAGEISLNPTQGQYLYVHTDGVVKKTTSEATATAGLLLFYVATDTSGVISSTDHRVDISLEEIIKKLESDQVPDASLIEKGKVKLSNKVDDTSQTDAATPKAVNDARQAAINAAAAYTETTVVQGYKDAQNYVDSKPWQKVEVTSASGFALNISSANLNDPRNTGWYMGTEVVNAPSNEWHFFEIIRHNNLWEVQKAYNFNGVSFRQRMKQNGVWTAWSPDVFQSGVDAKQGIVNAINAKGGSASTNDTWAQLAAKINAIQTGAKYATGTVISSDLDGRVIYTRSTMETILRPSVVVSGLGFKPSMIFIGAKGVFNNGEAFTTLNGMYSKSIKHAAWPSYSWYWGPGYTSTPELWRVIEDSIPAQDAYVTNGGFRLPFMYTDYNLVWEAYG
ncbi:hypothetical protein CHH60_08730 [Paenibacillus sp. 7523-1]|nr:hypothetical protein CHH60_08730 [Paenibacillus sp. 7523-1]